MAHFRPLVEFAVQQRWPIIAADLSRAEARGIIRDPSVSGLPLAPALAKELASDIADSQWARTARSRRATLLPGADIVSIGFMEVDAERVDPCGGA